MSRRNTYIFGFIVLMTLIFSTNVAAQRTPQRTPLPDAYQEYVFNLNRFFNLRKEYDANRSKYIAYKTVSAQEEALTSTIKMLESSRVTMHRYIELMELSLLQQEDFNARVKNALLNDLTTHKTFLADSEATVKGVTTLNDAVIVSNALQIRYTYVRASATQSLTYIDVMTAKKRNDNARTIVNDFKSLVAGYPPDNNNRLVVEKWTEEMIPQLAENESLLNVLIEKMYPAETNTDKPLFEKKLDLELEGLSKVNSRHLQYTQRFKEINQIAREAYKEL